MLLETLERVFLSFLETKERLPEKMALELEY